MQDFVHLHVHTHYSLLDGQASVPRLVDKAIADGMRGMAITDHGNMMAIKEFFNYVKGVRGKAKSAISELETKRALIESGEYRTTLNAGDADLEKDDSTILAEIDAEIKKKSIAANFKPIFGCEMYVARNGLHKKTTKEDGSGWHLVVLAKNKKGYHNLIKLVSKGYTEGYYYRPRTDKNELEKYHEGLIISSACLGGEIPQKIMRGNIDEAKKAVQWFKDIFADDYYLEMQRHEVQNVPANMRVNREVFAEQQKVNPVIQQIGAEMGVKVLCTNDCHFVDEENAEAHDRLICLSTGKDLDDPTRMVYTKQEWFKTRAEMNAIFADVPEVMQNTIEVCDKVEIYDIDHEPIMPSFRIPQDFGTEEEYRAKFTEEDLYKEFASDENGENTLPREEGEKKIKALGGYDRLYRIKFEADYLSKLAFEGAEKRYGDELDDDKRNRLRFELHIMKTMGFPGYFLIVQDYIRVAREQLGVSVGPGRGSAAGSVVAYCLWITQIDPLKYDLLFERFLNPDRISLPDIDIDFDDDGRGAVLNWVTDTYGAEKVAHIITYGTMATKSAIKDVARVEKVPLSVSNHLCKLIPIKLPEDANGKTPKMNLPNAIAAIPELREAENSPNQQLRDTIKYAKMLEGNVRNTGVHACGIIICKDDISDWVPVSTVKDKETNEDVICTQYEGKVIEETGLIKMDFLGLKTLSIIKEAIANIKQTLGIDVDIDNIPIDDPDTYKLYCEGKTVGTFQFESAGMQKYLRELQPSTFEDLIAMNALYRPGPMQYIPQFIRRKHGEEPIVYDLPCMEKYLKDTYGVTVYQEQVMLLSREIAGFTRGESDNLRKAMGKKLIGKLNQMYPKFLSGGKANGYDEKVLEKIWEDWRAFASYAFNKSHAACYSWVAYQTAYLKAHYPAQYMAGVLSRSLSDIKEVGKFMEECKSMGIEVKGPDINESQMKFSVSKDGVIRFGLAAIKGMGEAAAQAILEERNKNGKYTDIFNFVERVNLNSCNRKNIECLAYTGAFDCFGEPREKYFTENSKGELFMDALCRYGIKFQQDSYSNSNSLFGDIEEVRMVTPEIPKEYQEWSTFEKLNKEKELISIYLSAHPLDDHKVIINNICNTNSEEYSEYGDFSGLLKKKQNLSFAGIVTSTRNGTTKQGKPYCIVKIEDYLGTYELPLFGDNFTNWRNFFVENTSLLINAVGQERRFREGELELRITNVQYLAEAVRDIIHHISISVNANEVDERVVSELLSVINNNPGNTDISVVLHASNRQNITLSAKNVKVSVNKDIIDFIEQEDCLKYKIN